MKIEIMTWNIKRKVCVFKIFKIFRIIKVFLVLLFEMTGNENFFKIIRRAPSLRAIRKTTHCHFTSLLLSYAIRAKRSRYVQYFQRIDTIHSSRRSYGDVLAQCDLSCIERRPKFYRSNSHDENCIAPARLVYAKLLSSRLFSAHSIRDVKRNHSGHLGIISEVYSWAAVHFH